MEKKINSWVFSDNNWGGKKILTIIFMIEKKHYLLHVLLLQNPQKIFFVMKNYKEIIKRKSFLFVSWEKIYYYSKERRKLFIIFHTQTFVWLLGKRETWAQLSYCLKHETFLMLAWILTHKLTYAKFFLFPLFSLSRSYSCKNVSHSIVVSALSASSVSLSFPLFIYIHFHTEWLN